MLSISSEKQSALTGAKACKVVIRRKKKGARVRGLHSGGIRFDIMSSEKICKRFPEESGSWNQAKGI